MDNLLPTPKQGVKNMEDFFGLTTLECIAYSFDNLKTGKWDMPTYEKAMRSYWRQKNPDNHSPIVDNIRDIFGITSID